MLIHFDGWSSDYDYWCPRDSVELHPARWCLKHGWELQAPYSELRGRGGREGKEKKGREGEWKEGRTWEEEGRRGGV